jgi:hypothetical protein
MEMKRGVIFFCPLTKQQIIDKVVKTVDDYTAYRQTLTEPCSDVYTDNIQSDYDAYDTYQGCQSWYEYQKEWN